jgi:formylglycine-generating enzyme required for sulfatase activity
MMGRDNGVDEAERPEHQVKVEPFFIDTYEVTNEDYQKFVRATGHRAPMTWQKGTFPSDGQSKPVTGVSWDDANSYAQWAGKRLPTEEQWEFAARGTDGRIYPWGNSWQQDSANAAAASKGTTEVGSYKGTSTFGVFDMIGNAWEWTASDFRAYPGGRLPASVPSGELKVIRGGSYESTRAYATTTYRTGWPARGAKTYDQTGFRCVKDVQ